MPDQTNVEAKLSAGWGVFRHFIAAHPLTGFWTGVVLGAGLMFLVRPLL